MKLLSVKRTTSGTKAFKAIFKMDNGREKSVKFGTDSNYVLNSKKTDADRLAYLARHRVREDWSKPTTPGSLSRWLLWESRSLATNVRNFKKRFKI